MRYKRRYLQFNNLVFYGADIIKDADATVSVKYNTTAKAFGHGSYLPLKGMYLEEQSVSMTVTFAPAVLPCAYRVFYRNYIIEELSKPGKLWAVQNNEIVWANAIMTSYAETGEYEIDLDFLIWDGVWHKADKQATFLAPFDICLFMECKGYRRVHPCETCESCELSKEEAEIADDCCMCCEQLEKDMALCFHEDLSGFYAGCDSPYQIVYDCAAADRLFNEHGQRICSSGCDNMLAGRVYAETDIPTRGITITISGTMHDPEIRINGNTNILKGDYDGKIVIYPSGDTYFTDERCCETLIDPSKWVIPEGNTYGWTMKPRNNGVVINTNNCCGTTCAYISVDNLTF